VRKCPPRHLKALCYSTIIVDHATQDVSPFNRTSTCATFQRNRTPLVNPPDVAEHDDSSRRRS
jgi:hypothetical protein